ncbi:MAG TPA: sterol desaturase family protein, partial [Chitinophagales bacterium]|nr:sterol desaturase family protein [Chitinophagales bacterium]
IPFFLLAIATELFINWREQMNLYESKEALSSIGMGLGSLVINVVMKALAYGCYTILYQYRIFDLGWHWYTWVLILFADDFTFYWHHRLSHEIRLLWAAHVNHHSSQTLNLATALRQSWAEQLYKYFWWFWLPLVGFPPLMILMMMSISLIYQYWVHTELIRRLPRWYEFIFNTPSHHRVHHASNVRYLDQNHAGILIIWDRLFGTFAPERDDDKPIYGLTKNIETYNLFKIASHEFVAIWHDVKSAPTFKDKLKYIFYPPGWSHNGPDLRARTLRRQQAAKEKSVA